VKATFHAINISYISETNTPLQKLIQIQARTHRHGTNC